MASFTDSPQTFFSQATPKVDLNLYGQTLDYKQQMYNQGVQRIQGSIDKVAGLDIMHPLAKEYLHTKLTDLGSKINQMAGGDFSNQSLVSQAMSLAPQVAKDEKIQTALLATQQIRALSASQKRLYEKDPNLYPSSMRWMDNQAVNNYLNGTDLDEGYHGTTEASRYIDYHKDIEGLVKEIVPDVKLEVNPDGRYQWKTEKYSTVTNDRIQGVINGYFASHPEANHSMSADALYTYRNASPEFMMHHLDEIYMSNIHSLSDINKKYLTEIISHPTSRDFIEDRRAAMASNEETIRQMYNKLNKYRDLVYNPGMLDEIKRTIYTDNVKGMYSTIFQKDDVDRKIEENYNAKNADDFALKRAAQNLAERKFGLDQVKAKEELVSNGFEPYVGPNGEIFPISQDSKYYPVYQAGLKKGKGKDGSSSDDEYQFDGPTEYGETATKAKYGSTALLDDQMKVLQKAIISGNVVSEKGTGVQDMFFAKWKTKHTDLVDNIKDPQEKEKVLISAFNNYLAGQQKDFLEGKTTTAEFREYWDKASRYQLLLSSLDELRDKALTYANSIHMDRAKQDWSINLSNNNDYHPDPNSKNAISFSMTKDKDLVVALNNLKNAVDKDNNLAESSLHWYNNSDVVTRLVESYKGTPVYNKLKKIQATDKGLFGAYTHIQSIINNEGESTQADINDYLKQNDKNFAPLEYELKGKEGDANNIEAKRRIYSMLGNKQGISDTKEKYNLEKHGPEDIEVLSASVDAAGYPRYKFRMKGGKTDYVTSNKALNLNDHIIPMDPDADIKRTIEITGSTPSTGPGVLTAGHGKIRFQISRSTYEKNMYDASVIVAGHPMEIRMYSPNGDIIHAQTPSQIIKSLEEISRLPSRSNPKVPMSREECYDKLTMSTHEYEEKYPKPTTNK